MTRTLKPALLLSLALTVALPRIADAQEAMLTLVNTMTGTEVSLSEAEVLAMPQHIINTENDNVDAMTAFEGPLGRDLLALVGAEGAVTAVLTAVNDYSVEVPVEDFLNYDVIFALSADGVPFSRRDKGPIWVVYPMSDHAELYNPTVHSSQVWQLVRMEVK